MEQELERLEGTVEDIIYLNEDNGYTVFEVSGGGVVTVVCGVVGELHAGESVVCRGSRLCALALYPFSYGFLCIICTESFQC